MPVNGLPNPPAGRSLANPPSGNSGFGNNNLPINNTLPAGNLPNNTQPLNNNYSSAGTYSPQSGQPANTGMVSRGQSGWNDASLPTQPGFQNRSASLPVNGQPGFQHESGFNNGSAPPLGSAQHESFNDNWKHDSGKFAAPAAGQVVGHQPTEGEALKLAYEAAKRDAKKELEELASNPGMALLVLSLLLCTSLAGNAYMWYTVWDTRNRAQQLLERLHGHDLKQELSEAA